MCCILMFYFCMFIFDYKVFSVAARRLCWETVSVIRTLIGRITEWLLSAKK